MAEEINEEMLAAARAANTSGQGSNSIVPEDVAEHFNWGAFFFTWIWGVGNKVWWLLLIPVLFSVFGIGLGWYISKNIMMLFGLPVWAMPVAVVALIVICLSIHIIVGLKGNAWAWKTEYYESESVFHRIQQVWAKIGVIYLIIFLISLAVQIALMALPMFLGAKMSKSAVEVEEVTEEEAAPSADFPAMRANLTNIAKQLEADGVKCTFTPCGVFTCFENHIEGVRFKFGHSLSTDKNETYYFDCTTSMDDETFCYVKISTKDDMRGKIIPLLLNEEGFIYLGDKTYDSMGDYMATFYNTEEQLPEKDLR